MRRGLVAGMRAVIALGCGGVAALVACSSFDHGGAGDARRRRPDEAGSGCTAA